MDDISQVIETKLHDLSQKFEAFSIAVDESTDVVDTVQLATFIRGMDINFNITEEFAALYSMKESITGAELYEQVMRVIEKINLNLNKVHGITTNAAPAMVGEKSGLTALITGETDKASFTFGSVLLHHTSTISLFKSNKNNHVMNIVVSTVNFIRSRSLNHRQFRKLLIGIEADYGDVICHSEVRWLSGGKS
jgi:hypothetical protein